MPVTQAHVSAGRARTPALQDLVDLTAELVRTPSQAGIDPIDGVIERVEGWLEARGVRPERLGPPDAPVGLYLEFAGRRPGPTYVLDAPLDTAPAGPASAWRHDPFSAVIEDGWLHGRGSADCKAGVAVFSHLAVELARRPPAAGTVGILFDGDEHTGGFAGIRAMLDRTPPSKIAGVMVGYPGDREIVVGGRGFLRLRLALTGPGGHSGSRRTTTPNPVVKAAALVTALAQTSPPSDPAFPVDPKITVTAVEGGYGFSTVPTHVTANIDIRLTPAFDAEAARDHVTAVVRAVDNAHPSHPATAITEGSTWPAYRCADDDPIVVALAKAAGDRLGRTPPLVVAGPSNIGNLLAAHGISATAGFGVAHRGLHAANEAIDIATLPQTFDVYAAAVDQLLAD